MNAGGGCAFGIVAFLLVTSPAAGDDSFPTSWIAGFFATSGIITLQCKMLLGDYRVIVLILNDDVNVWLCKRPQLFDRCDIR